MYPDETTTPADPDGFAPDADDGWWINRRAAVRSQRDAIKGRRGRVADTPAHSIQRDGFKKPNARRIGFR